MRPSYRNKRLSGICVGLKITSPALMRIARPTVIRRSCTGRGRPAVPAKRSVQLSIFIFTSELGQHNHPQLERCALWDHRGLLQYLQESDRQELSKKHPAHPERPSKACKSQSKDRCFSWEGNTLKYRAVLRFLNIDMDQSDEAAQPYVKPRSLAALPLMLSLIHI